MPRKANKARSILFKAVGTSVILASFVGQTFFVDRWRDAEIELGKGLSASFELEAKWNGALAKWTATSTDRDSQIELRVAAVLLLVQNYSICTRHQSVCNYPQFHDPSRVEILLPFDTELSKISQRMVSHIQEFRPIRRDLSEHGSALNGLVARAKTGMVLAYVIGTLLLVLGLWFEWRGVDE